MGRRPVKRSKRPESKAKLAVALKERNEALEQQAASAEILRVIASSPTDIKPVMAAVVENAARLADADHVLIGQAEDGAIRWLAAHGCPLPEGPLPISRALPSGRAILDLETTQVEDVSHIIVDHERLRRAYRELGVRTILATPLVRERRAIGVLLLRRTQVHPFADKQIALLRTFADQAVIAIENVRLFNETKEALEQQKASAEVLGAISSSIVDTKPVFDKILEGCERLIQGHFTGIGLAGDDGFLHVVAAPRGVQPSVLASISPIPLSNESGSGLAITERRIVHFPDIFGTADAPPILRRNAEKAGLKSMVFAPMFWKDKAIGTIYVGRKFSGAFTDKQIALLKTFADQAVIAIENVRLFNETKEALEQQKASGEVLSAISSSIADTKPVFDKILEGCERLFEGHYMAIGLAGEDGFVDIVARRGLQPSDLTGISAIPLSNSGSGLAITEGRIVHFPDVFGAADAPPVLRHNAGKFGLKSIIFAPMFWENKAIGTIHVGRKFIGAFTDKQIALLKTFADQAVIAIENVRLFNEIQDKTRQLEVANKHKSDFLANMSHELRTPLNAIIGFSEALMERMFGEVNDKQADYLKDIHESGHHLLSLINDILDLSKIEAGRMDLEVSTFHLPTALQNAMTLIRERAQRHSIDLRLDVDERLGEFRADERKFKQIMLNLLSNAVKFTPDGGRVEIIAKTDTNRVEVAVRDSGIGIAPEEQGAVFEEFRQVGRDQPRKAEGTGLGLALTKRFVELHGGAIRMQSAPGNGSTFIVSLPVSRK